MRAPNRSGSTSYSAIHRWTSGLVSSTSTLDARNSITSLRECCTRSVSVVTFMPVLGRAAARRHQRARALDLDDADATRVHRRQVVGETQRGRVDPLRPTRVEDRGALRDAHRLPVDLDVEQPARRIQRDRAHALAPAASNRWSRCTADCTADGRRLAEPADRRVAHDLGDLVDQRELLLARADLAAVHQPVQRLLLANGADAARHALAARFVAEEPGDPEHDVHQVDRLVQHHHDPGAQRVAPGARVLERELDVQIVRRDEARRPRRPAGPPSAVPCDPAGQRPAPRGASTPDSTS